MRSGLWKTTKPWLPPAAFLVDLDLKARAHHAAPAPGTIGLADTGVTKNDRRRGEIRARHMRHELIDSNGRVVDIGETGVDDFGEIAAACAVHASIGMPPGGQLAVTTQADAPNIMAKERAVRIQRVTDMRRNLVRRLRRMLTRFAGILRITA